MIGKTLAHYEIEGALGAGGMGEVYLARDTRLGRAVAVKVLPEVLAADPERIARFEREAKVLASLNHPNIAALHGLEEFEGRHFLVMELVEGETLAEQIARGPLAVDEALKIVHQIVEALEAAHEKGVVHRDLKPANVKMTREGKVKVLDFGLAKAMENAPGNAHLSQSPTLSLAATNAGVILGTAAYMSPEQAKGASVDPRSDIFSFGCLFYEMLTGRQPFQGDSLAEVLADVLAREPDLAALPARLHPRIPELLRRCLEKNPKKRWHAAADLRVEIETILEDPRGLRVLEQSGAGKRPLWKRAIPVVAAVILSAGIAALAAWNLKPSPPPQIARYPFTLPDVKSPPFPLMAHISFTWQTIGSI
jgi:eukaryotic-like serine/threonine-protein kinase